MDRWQLKVHPCSLRAPDEKWVPPFCTGGGGLPCGAPAPTAPAQGLRSQPRGSEPAVPSPVPPRSQEEAPSSLLAEGTSGTAQTGGGRRSLRFLQPGRRWLPALQRLPGGEAAPLPPTPCSPLLPTAPRCSCSQECRAKDAKSRGVTAAGKASARRTPVPGSRVGEAERQLPCRSPAEAAGSLPLPAAFSHGEGCGFRLFPLQILNGTSGGRGNACRCLETAPRVTGPGAGGRPEGLLPETSDRGARGHPPARDTHPPSREHFPAWRRGSQMTGSPLSPGSRHSPGRGRAPARRQRVAGGSAECGRCGRQGRVQLHCGGPTPSCLPSGTHSCQGEQGPRPPLLQGRAAFVPVLSQIPRNGHPRAPFSVPKDPTEPLGH